MSDYVTLFESSFTPKLLNTLMKELQHSIVWEQHDKDRREAFFNRCTTPYQYSEGGDFRPQFPQPEPDALNMLWAYVEWLTHSTYGYCFINDYLNPEAGIGWHTDASASINPEIPVTVMALGVERATSYRPLHHPEVCEPDNIEHFTAKSGEVLMMNVGTNQNYEHAVLPDALAEQGSRLSLVFRGYEPFEGQLKEDYKKHGTRNVVTGDY